MSSRKITKSNHLIEASYSLPLQAQKLLLTCLSKLDSRYEIPKEITLSAMEFSRLTGSKNARRDLYRAADALFKASIVINTQEEETEVCWIQEKAKKHKGDGSITLLWSDRVLRYISQIQSNFTSYRLRHVVQFQSPYTIRIYELLMQFNSTKERVIFLKDFRSMLGIEDKYPEFKELNKKIIKPALLEINEKSDLVVQYSTIKSGRSIASLAFDFTQKKNS